MCKLYSTNLTYIPEIVVSQFFILTFVNPVFSANATGVALSSLLCQRGGIPVCSVWRGGPRRGQQNQRENYLNIWRDRREGGSRATNQSKEPTGENPNTCSFYRYFLSTPWMEVIF